MPDLFDKKLIHEAITDALKNLVENAKSAMLLAYETATHEENIAENKYDTLGLEAAYLAQGQARRLAECENDLAAFQNIAPRPFETGEAVAIGALVHIEDEDGNGQYLFLGPAAGGLKIVSGGRDIVVVTPSAPLGKALLNTGAGDTVTLHLAATQKQYEVVAIY